MHTFSGTPQFPLRVFYSEGAGHGRAGGTGRGGVHVDAYDHDHDHDLGGMGDMGSPGGLLSTSRAGGVPGGRWGRGGLGCAL